MITSLAISGYRSLREVTVSLSNLTIVSGGNGTGKSSLYRALRLLADCAQGRVISSLAQEGGLMSTLWAGPESFSRTMKSGEHPIQGIGRKKSISLKLGFGSDDYSYAIDLGLPTPSTSFFSQDPEIKSEHLWMGPISRPANMLAKRNGPGVTIRSDDDGWQQVFNQLASTDSMMTHCSDPVRAAELLIAREQMRDWRFYDHFRTDSMAPSRSAQTGTYTPVLSGDGHDLAAAIQTIREIGEHQQLESTIADAFGGASVSVSTSGGFTLEMIQHGLLRPLSASELSDGTLRYLLLVAALLSPRPPKLMVLNEPETSLHPELIAPLARLIAHASKSTQMIVVSHSDKLVQHLSGQSEVVEIVLEKILGETIVQQNDAPTWHWPSSR
ncbi:MAG: AAA family ATPase [Parasphingorhabdus sp.]